MMTLRMTVAATDGRNDWKFCHVLSDHFGYEHVLECFTNVWFYLITSMISEYFVVLV
jgi:hypothetical protein